MNTRIVRLDGVADLTWPNVTAIAWHDASVALSPQALPTVDEGRRRFLALLERGVPCYGVTTGLGKLVGVELDDAARSALAHNILLGRAAATGPAHTREMARTTMVLKLANFLSGCDGVTPALCLNLVEAINDGLTPCIPRLGHGMGGDAVAHSHCFQTLVGEGTVLGPAGEQLPASQWFEARSKQPYRPVDKEGISLVSGVAASVAFAMCVTASVQRWADLALLTAACSMEGMAAPRDAIDPVLLELPQRTGTQQAIERLNQCLGGSEVRADRLQAPVSYRIVPQVHGALFDAIGNLEAEIDFAMRAFSDNPVLLQGDAGDDRLLSQGSFHDQHLVNAVEQLSLALVHAGALGERRLHRLMDGAQTGLSPQLAHRPGLDAGQITSHKACVEILARAKAMTSPVSLWTSETSGGQEDYMSLIFPALDRLETLVDLLDTALSYELLAACAAIDLRGQRPGTTVRSALATIRKAVPVPGRDRSPGPDAQAIKDLISQGALDHLLPNRFNAP